jgi:DNA-binding CsgD family transcriptional regulator
VLGRADDAISAAEAAEKLTRSGDVRVLGAAARAIVSLTDSDDDDDAAHRLLEIASNSGFWDGLVCAIRSWPALLPQLVDHPSYRAELQEVLIRSNDVRLARSVGLATHTAQLSGVLTPREREVIDHVAQGKRNADIATSLFITVATVKRHLDRAYHKLGARSRTEAIARYAEIVNAEREASGDA